MENKKPNKRTKSKSNYELTKISKSKFYTNRKINN